MGLVGSALMPAFWLVRGPHWEGLLSALVGLAACGGIIWAIRIIGSAVLRREAMGFGDVLLMGLIGAVLGWEAALLVFFVAPFFGLGYGLWQLARHRDHEVPYGPFLSMGAGVVMLAQVGLAGWFSPGLGALWQAIRGG